MNSQTEDKELIVSDSGRVSSLDHWNIFAFLSQSQKEDIRRVWVFGRSGKECFYVTQSDDLLYFGLRSMSCLTSSGLQDTAFSLLPYRVEPMCKKGVVKMDFGEGHAMALTASGTLWAWGKNDVYQLGNGSLEGSATPIQVGLGGLGRPSNKRIVDVACGSTHTLALTSDGDVYGWGGNHHGQVGTGMPKNQPTPLQLTGRLRGRRIKAIACSNLFSLAISEDEGKVFCWGHNVDHQLGTGWRFDTMGKPVTSITKPCKIMKIRGIAKVVCGVSHTMLLSDDGSIHVFGDNRYGQLGIGCNSDRLIPVRVASELGPFIDIGASKDNRLSVAMSVDGKVYVWGQCKGHVLRSPFETSLKTVDDAFAAFGSWATTFRTLELKPKYGDTILRHLFHAFDDETTSDIKFIVEGKAIHVHKALLRIRCEHFRLMFGTFWAEDSKSEIIINHFAYPVYYAFLRYLYTDEVRLEVEDAIDLLDLANSYCETDLKKKCERLLRDNIDSDNVSIIFAAALKLEIEDLKDYCLRFLLEKWQTVEKTQTFKSLDEETHKQIMELVQNFDQVQIESLDNHDHNEQAEAHAEQVDGA